MGRRRRRGVWAFVRRHRDGWPWVVLGLLALGTWLSANADRPLLWAALGAAGLAGAVVLVWWLRRRWAAWREQRSVARTDLSGVDLMTGTEFEAFVASLLRTHGYRQVEVVGGASDGGADVRARAPDGRAVVVQCKRWRRPVPPNEVRAFVGTLSGSHRGFTGVFVASRGFTDAAVREAGAGHDAALTLVGREDLALWMRGERAPELPPARAA